MWNTDLTLDSNKLLNDLSNAVLLRSDLHTAFDERKFVFFPKSEEGGFVVHMLEPTPELGQLFHNVHVQPLWQCNARFLYARFAWAIFPSLAGFLSKPNAARRLIFVKADDTHIEWVEEEVIGMEKWRARVSASRNCSPRKRQRAAELDDLGIVETIERSEAPPGGCKRRRQTSNKIPSPGLSSSSGIEPGADSEPKKNPGSNDSPQRGPQNQNLVPAWVVATPSLSNDEFSDEDPVRAAAELEEDLALQRTHIPNFHCLEKHQEPPGWYPGWRSVERLKRRWINRSQPAGYDSNRDFKGKSPREGNRHDRVGIWTDWGVEVREDG